MALHAVPKTAQILSMCIYVVLASHHGAAAMMSGNGADANLASEISTSRTGAVRFQDRFPELSAEGFPFAAK